MYVHISVNVCCVCIWTWKPGEGVRCPGTEVSVGCELPRGCWGLNPGSLKEPSLCPTFPGLNASGMDCGCDLCDLVLRVSFMHARAPCEAVTGRGKDYKQPFVSFSKSSHRYKYPIAIEKGQLCLPFLASWGNTFLNNSVLGLVGLY